MILTFGKWKTKTVQWVAMNEPGYFRWLANKAMLDREMACAIEDAGHRLAGDAEIRRIRQLTAQLVEELVLIDNRYCSWQPW